jgi:hypothetical protein
MKSGVISTPGLLRRAIKLISTPDWDVEVRCYKQSKKCYSSEIKCVVKQLLR